MKFSTRVQRSVVRRAIRANTSPPRIGVYHAAKAIVPPPPRKPKR
jgi:hypothetical protein